jgi:hypothetical protein
MVGICSCIPEILNLFWTGFLMENIGVSYGHFVCMFYGHWYAFMDIWFV